MIRRDTTPLNGTIYVPIFLLLISVLISAGCGSPQPSAKNSQEASDLPPEASPEPGRPVPKTLSDAGELGENIYDAANSGDWETAAAMADELANASGALADEKIDPPGFSETLAELQGAVKAKDKRRTLHASNRITLEVTEFMAGYSVKIPPAIAKLDYLGREIEILSAEKNDKQLRETVQDLRTTWNAVKPKVVSAGGTEQAKEFEELVAKTEVARSPAEYGKLAAPILDKVDDLEKVFVPKG